MILPYEPLPPLVDPGAPSVEHWKQRVRNLPDLRWTKVVRARQSLQSGAYEREVLLDAVLASLANDIGVLCRRQNGGRLA
ncbi:MAG: hypothetical protein ACYSUI_00820 [Planctomycetota bacterium]